MLDILLSLFIVAQVPDSVVWTCDSLPDPKRFGHDFSEGLRTAHLTINWYYFPVGISEPELNSREQRPITSISVDIPSDPPEFWCSVLRDGLDSVLTQVPANPSSKCIGTPQFTCGCGTMSLKVTLASELRTFTIQLDNCDVKFGTMTLVWAGREYHLTLKKRNAASVRKYLQELLELSLPRQYRDCGL